MILFKAKAIYLYIEPIDMRKSIDGLNYIMGDLRESGLATTDSLTIFYNRARDKVKLLFWDKNGFVMVYKRLERGKFKITRCDESQMVSLDSKQLSWLLAGLDYDLMSRNKDLDFSEFY